MEISDVCLVFITVAVLVAAAALWEQASTEAALNRHYLAREKAREKEVKG